MPADGSLVTGGDVLRDDENPQLQDYANERIFQRNRLPPRAYFIPQHSILLNGRWRFHYAPRPSFAPSLPETLSASSTIEVPGHWQLQGHGKPHIPTFNSLFLVTPRMSLQITLQGPMRPIFGSRGRGQKTEKCPTDYGSMALTAHSMYFSMVSKWLQPRQQESC